MRDNAHVASLTILFFAVLVLNVIPAFAPPTWMALSFFGFRHPDAHPWLVALVAASGATSGRLVLAHFAKRIVRNRWLPSAMPSEYPLRGGRAAQTRRPVLADSPDGSARAQQLGIYDRVAFRARMAEFRACPSGGLALHAGASVNSASRRTSLRSQSTNALTASRPATSRLRTT